MRLFDIRILENIFIFKYKLNITRHVGIIHWKLSIKYKDKLSFN
jgi:hypothetical protein